MSLLEDIFLQDEANEARELERIIEGDDFEGRPRSDSENNSEKEDEAEEDKRKVDPASTKTRRVIKNPRFILNPARLTGPRGIQVIPDHFKDFKFKGKGHEREDLDLVLKKLEHWAYRLYPKFQFEDCLKKIETLGKKRPVMVHLHKIRTDQYLTEETVVQKDSSDEEPPPEDEFDKLLQQQIELARSTPAPNSAKKGFDSVIENRPLIMPKATSSPSISEEQKERMLRNRKLAEERRLARLKNITNTNFNNSQNTLQSSIPEVNNEVSNENAAININNDSEIVSKRHNISNIVESSDEEEITLVNESIRVDIHMTRDSNYIVNGGDISIDDKSISGKVIEKSSEKADTDFDNIINGKDINVETPDDIGQEVNDNNMNIDSTDIDNQKVNDNNIHIDTSNVNNRKVNDNNINIVTLDSGNQKNYSNTNIKSSEVENQVVNDNNNIETITLNNQDGSKKADDKVMNSNDKANALNNENFDDLMDVDFDDDF